MTEDQKNKANFRDLKDTFKAIDKDNDGFISIKELITAMRVFGFNPSLDELQMLVREYDKDEDEVIDLSEFIDIMNMKIAKKKEEEEEDEDILETFQMLDRNGDGVLSKEEVKYLFDYLDEEINDELLDDLFYHFDADKDGFLTIEDFINFMKSN